MALLVSILGLLLIAFTIYDIFETLFNPEGQGPLTDAISWNVWKGMKALPGSLIGYAGPVAYVTMLAVWAFLIHLGWALVYWLHLPDSFAYADGIEGEAQTGFTTAFYISLTTTSTLGYGDIVPIVGWLRLIGPAQSLIGFLLLTAAITWILAIYQDIETRRSLAQETTLMQEMIEKRGIDLAELSPGSIERLLDELISRIIRVTGSLNQFPITYFFRISDPRQSFSEMALFLYELSEELEQERLPQEVRLQASMLAGALDELAESLDGKFVDVGPDASTRDVLVAYARDHQRTVVDHYESNRTPS